MPDEKTEGDTRQVQDAQPPPPRERAGGEGFRALKINSALTLARAKQLRQIMTDAERLLWSILRNRGLNNRKFKRQVPVGPYIADFVCESAMLIIELDGGQHATQIDKDLQRTRWLESQGFRVARFLNNEVLQNLAGVHAAIAALLSLPIEIHATHRVRPRELTP